MVSPMDHPGPVTAADVRTAVSLAVRTLAGFADQQSADRTEAAQAWQAPAGDLTWTCWETVEHIADDLFAYAAQLCPERPPRDAYVPFGFRRRPGGPALTVTVEPDAGPAGLLQVLDAAGGLLAATVTVTPPDRRAFHPMGLADAEGFAAMGVVEVLAHMHDLAGGLGVRWNPPADLCDRVLRRLFPGAPTGTDRWATLLWATGRGDLPGHDRPGEWRWDANPRFELTTGVVREFDADQGWGVVDGPDLPGGCWVHFGALAMDGPRRLIAGQAVTVRAERADQDGFGYRAVKVWTGDTEPAPQQSDRSTAYRSTLTLTFD